MQAFISGFPVGISAGWQPQSQALIAAVNATSKSPWQNAPPGNAGAVVDNVVGPGAGNGYPPPKPTSTGTTSAAASSVSFIFLTNYAGER